MTAELFAIASAFFLGASAVTSKLGLKKLPSPFASVFMFLAGSAILWAIVFALGLALPTREGALWFMLRGVFDPGIAGFLVYSAFRKIGAAVTTPIIAAYPLVSTSLSILFLGETLNRFIIAGTFLIIAGVAFLNLRHVRHRINLKHVVFAIMGSVLIAFATIATKLGLNASNTPISGLAVSFITGVALNVAIITSLRKWKELPFKWDKTKMFVLTGFIASTGFIFNYLAFSQGLVSVIAPLSSTMPLFTIFLLHIFFRNHEIISKNIILGTLMIVSGAALLTAF